MDQFSTEQFRTANGIVSRQVAAESQNDNCAAPPALAFRSVTGARENVKGANIAHTIPLVGNLALRRDALGWSIKELSDRCGIDQNFLGEWERGIGSPRLDAVEPWARALGVELAFAPAENKGRRGVQVDWDKRCIAVDGKSVRLTPMEWKALERLAWTPGELVTHQALFRHLYGDDRQHRAQSTAVRVLITKLRRLLPIRVEARWGQGYVISGLEPPLPRAQRADDGAGVGAAAPRAQGAEQPCERTLATPKAAPPILPPIRHERANLTGSNGSDRRYP